MRAQVPESPLRERGPPGQQQEQPSLLALASPKARQRGRVRPGSALPDAAAWRARAAGQRQVWRPVAAQRAEAQAVEG